VRPRRPDFLAAREAPQWQGRPPERRGDTVPSRGGMSRQPRKDVKDWEGRSISTGRHMAAPTGKGLKPWGIRSGVNQAGVGAWHIRFVETHFNASLRKMPMNPPRLISQTGYNITLPKF